MPQFLVGAGEWKAIVSMEQLQFSNRVKQLARKHDAMTRGYAVSVRTDGLIVAQPRRSLPGVSLKAVVLFIIAFIAFKGFLIASVGFATYEDRLDRLQAGTVAEQAGAWVMQIDPVAERIAEKISPYLP